VSSLALKGGAIFSASRPEGRGAGPSEQTATGGGDAAPGDGEREARDCFFVFVFAPGRSDERGLAIRAADGEWVSIAQVSSALLANTDASLCALVASTYSLDDAPCGQQEAAAGVQRTVVADSRAASTLLLPRRASSTANLKVDSWRTLVQLWTLVPARCEGWLNENGSVLHHVVADRLCRAGDSADVEESLAAVAGRIDSYAAHRNDPAAGESGEGAEANRGGSGRIASGFQVLGAGQGIFGADPPREVRKGAGGRRGHRLALRGQGVMQPAFSPSGNTLVDNDGALVKLRQWQDFSVHSETVKVTMLSHTPGAEIFYTIDGSDPDVSSVGAGCAEGGREAVVQEAEVGQARAGTRRYNHGKPVLLEYKETGFQDFVVTALAMTPDMRQSRISRSPVYRVQGQVRLACAPALRLLSCERTR